MAQRIQIPRASDKALVQIIFHICKTYGFNVSGFKIVGCPNSPNPSTDGKDTVLEFLAKKDLSIIEYFSLQNSNHHITYHRGGTIEPRSWHTDELQFNDNFPLPLETHREISAYIIQKLQTAPSNKLPLNGGVGEYGLEAIHQLLLERLEATNQNLLEETQQYRIRLDKEFEEKRVNLVSRIELERQSFNEENDITKQKINAEWEKLEEARKNLDDRSNTHERRKIRRDLQSEIKARQQKFSLTEGTKKMRWPAAIALILLGSLSSYLAIYSSSLLYDAVKTNNLTIIISAAIKQTLYSFIALGTILYYFKWQNAWQEQHAQAEFQLKKFELDMERASWLVETSLEYQDNKGQPLPSELLLCLSSDLFTSISPVPKKPVHPVDNIASVLLRSARGIKLKVGDAEFDLDPSKVNKIKNTELE